MARSSGPPIRLRRLNGAADEWKTCRDCARGSCCRCRTRCAGCCAERAIHSAARLSHRRLRTQRYPGRQWHRRLLHAHQRTRRWHQPRQDHVRGMRHRLRHRSWCGVLRAPEGQRPHWRCLCPAALNGITFALTERAPLDKIPLITMGYGRSESRDGSVFQWNFPLLGTYWTAADIILQFIAGQERGWDKLRGKRIALVYHDSPYGKEPIALLQKRAQMHGFELLLLSVTHPGVEQKATWLQVRQNRPDYLLLWGWGVMNSTAIKEAVAVGYPREKMYGVWWSGAEQDVRPAEDGAKGYNSVALQHTAGQFKLHEDLKNHLYDKGKGTARWEDTGEILYVRGLINAMLGIEAIRTAQERFGKKPMTGEQVRWGLENPDITADRLKQLGFAGVLQPINVSCADAAGTRTGRIQTWDGKKWNVTSDWITSDDSVIAPMVKEAAAKYAAEKKIATGCLLTN